jgi:hypothetical protein
MGNFCRFLCLTQNDCLSFLRLVKLDRVLAFCCCLLGGFVRDLEEVKCGAMIWNCLRFSFLKFLWGKGGSMRNWGDFEVKYHEFIKEMRDFEPFKCHSKLFKLLFQTLQ